MNIKNDNVDIQICRITDDEMRKLIKDYTLTLEKTKQWDLQNGDLMIKGKFGKTILHSVSERGQLDIIEYVLDKGVDVDCLNNYKQTPLMYALWNNHIEVVNYLLDRGANINHQTNIGWSVLHYACNWNQLEVVKLLVERGIDIYLKGNFYKEDETALDVAKHCGYQELVDYLKSVIKERLKTDYEN